MKWSSAKWFYRNAIWVQVCEGCCRYIADRLSCRIQHSVFRRIHSLIVLIAGIRFLQADFLHEYKHFHANFSASVPSNPAGDRHVFVLKPAEVIPFRGLPRGIKNISRAKRCLFTPAKLGLSCGGRALFLKNVLGSDLFACRCSDTGKIVRFRPRALNVAEMLSFTSRNSCEQMSP